MVDQNKDLNQFETENDGKEKSFLQKLFALYKGKYKRKAIVFTIAIILALVVVIGFAIGKDGDTKINSISVLEKVIETNDLETLEYPYSAVATVSNDKGNPLFYVKYDADIIMAVDFTKVTIDVDDKAKTITINVPDATIKNRNIDPSKFEYLNEKKYNDDDLVNKAHEAAKADLDSRLKDEKQEMFDIAKDNAISFIKALTKPIADQLFSGYELIVR